MSNLKIASINCYTGINKISHLDLNSNVSLSQYDIIMFNISNIPSNIEPHIINYWKQQLYTAYKNNRLLIIMLNTNYLLSKHNQANYQGCYWMLPFAPIWKQETTGTDIKPCISNNKPILDFVNHIKILFKDDFYYASIFEDNNTNLSTILKNNNNEPIGFIKQDGKSCCLLIPQINFHNLIDAYKAIFIREDRKKTKEFLDNIQNQFLSALVRLHKALHTGNTYESEPEWLVGKDIYKTNEEIGYENSIQENKAKMAEIEQENKRFETNCLELGQLRHLLFAHDKPLEKAVNTALQILGAESTEYKNDENTLQIDNLIHYNGVTILGEDKGHEGYSNNDDINQLIANHGAYYDIECQETDEVPKAVLFVNSHRKMELNTRDKTKCCSDKTIKLSKAHKIPIVWTPDLFFIAKYVKDHNDYEFAKQCMDIMIQSDGGIVDFPEIPQKNK